MRRLYNNLSEQKMLFNVLFAFKDTFFHIISCSGNPSFQEINIEKLVDINNKCNFNWNNSLFRAK